MSALPDVKDFDLKATTDLCRSFRKNGIPKNSYHNYTKIYNHLLKDIPNIEPLNILEVNPDCFVNVEAPNKKLIFQIWKEHFTNSNVFTLNMKSNNIICDLNLNLVCEQSDEKSIEILFNKPYLDNIKYDLIIENGAKTIQENIFLFEKFIQHDKINKSGIYIIENIHFDDVKYYKSQIVGWKELYKNYDIKFYAVPKFNVWDNNIIVAKKII